jgi:hypothetical protein
MKRLALCKARKTKPLSACFKSVNAPEGRKRVAEHLKSLPYPHYEPAPDSPGLLVRIEADGKRTIGRFVKRKFQTVRPATR